MENETWRSVTGYEGSYSISSWGRVRSESRVIVRSDGKKQTLRSRILKQALIRSGSGRKSHMGVNLGILGAPPGAHYGSKPVHLLVLEAFIGPRPDSMEGCHNDGDVENNKIENLRWDSRRENHLDTLRHGTNPQANKTHCLNGHEFNEKNTYYHKSGNRYCGECHRQRSRERYGASKKEKISE
ncbi:MAG: NUMOD4 motif-containing HNH endonuclease [Candidatus Methylomirabilales bacterium]